MTAALIESTERYPGAPQPRFVPRVFRVLPELSSSAAFFVGAAHRGRAMWMSRARVALNRAERARLVGYAREEGRELVRWLRSARP